MVSAATSWDDNWCGKYNFSIFWKLVLLSFSLYHKILWYGQTCKCIPMEARLLLYSVSHVHARCTAVRILCWLLLSTCLAQASCTASSGLWYIHTYNVIACVYAWLSSPSPSYPFTLFHLPSYPIFPLPTLSISMFLFPFECRQSLFYLSAFDRDRAIARLQVCAWLLMCVHLLASFLSTRNNNDHTLNYHIYFLPTHAQ